jgi:hypothetical protein
MIISSAHHDLFNQFKKADETEGEVIKALNSYMATPNADWNIIKKLMQQFEEAHETKMRLYNKLKELSIAP